jgi:GNAT superfamily N-acetyltransferase
VIRPATMDDVPVLARILEDWISETAWMPRLHTSADHLGFLTHLILSTDVLVAGEPEPTGFIALDGEMIRALYLAPKARNIGQGAALLDHAKSLAERLVVWTFQNNYGAASFYRREGFSEVLRTDGQGNAEKLPDLQLIWEGRM